MNTWKMLALVLVVVLAVTACATPTPSAAPPSARVQQLQKAGKLVVGTAITAPFEYRDAQGVLIGFDVELAAVIANKAGVPIEWKEMAFGDLLPTLQSGKVDLVIAGMYITPQRQEIVDMSEGYIDTGLVIVTRANNTAIKTAQDLTDKKVGVKAGATGARYARALKDKGQNLTIQEYADTVNSLEDLSTGLVDAILNDKVNSIQYIKTHKDLKVASEVVDPAQLGMAVRKGDAELLTLINNTLREMKSNGSLEALYRKWITGS